MWPKEIPVDLTQLHKWFLVVINSISEIHVCSLDLSLSTRRFSGFVAFFFALFFIHFFFFSFIMMPLECILVVMKIL